MKCLMLVLSLVLNFAALAQNVTNKHPRVIELEDKLTQEASSYFSRRYPQDPFFVSVDINPLRRSVSPSSNQESLPYFDQESEELVDEWDDPTTPLSFLRNRIIKVNVAVSIPQSFDDQKVNDIKNELLLYLKLLPTRDEVKVERKFTTAEEKTPILFYAILGSVFLSALVIGLMMRWSVSKIKLPQGSIAAAAPAMSSGGQNQSAPQASKSSHGKSSTAVSGDVTFHDPIKTLDIVHIKIKQIEDAKNFPTLRDIILLSDIGEKNPEKLGAIISELPSNWQKELFKLGKDQIWLEAYAQPGQIDHDGLMTLDKMSRQRDYVAGEKIWEDLLIQIWRLEDKSANFFKKINSDHAFIILNMLPKSLSLSVAKKCFPGSWGKLLESKSDNVVIDPKIVKDYLNQAYDLLPPFEWKLLENYRKDREILTYLNKVSIEDERDIYETLSSDSFIFKVRAPFYKVFEANQEILKQAVHAFTLDQWALAVFNSSRMYVRSVSDLLDDKRKIIFSSNLKRLDQQQPNHEEQTQCRQMIAKYVSDLSETKTVAQPSTITEEASDEKIA